MSYSELKESCYKLMNDISSILPVMENFSDDKDLDVDDEDPAAEAYLDIMEHLDIT